MEKIVIDNDKKKHKKFVALITCLIIAIFLVISTTLTYFLISNHFSIDISVDPSVISAKGQEIHLQGTIKNVKRKELGNNVSLPNSEILLAHGDTYFYNCEIENKGNRGVDFSFELELEHATNSIITYTFANGENSVYTGDSFTGSLKSGESCSLSVCYKVSEGAVSSFIDTSMKIVITKGGEK